MFAFTDGANELQDSNHAALCRELSDGGGEGCVQHSRVAISLSRDDSGAIVCKTAKRSKNVAISFADPEMIRSI